MSTTKIDYRKQLALFPFHIVASPFTAMAHQGPPAMCPCRISATGALRGLNASEACAGMQARVEDGDTISVPVGGHA
jgi:hypothetical protein